MSAHRNGAEGPVAGHAWPDKLCARLTTPDEANVAGYSVADDLAEHHRFTDVLFLARRGELPTDRESALFEYVMTNLAPVSVGRAGAHLGVLARVCDSTDAATAGLVAIGIAEEARFEVERLRPLIVWYTHREGPLDPVFLAPRESVRARALLAGLARRGLALSVPESLSCHAILALALVELGFAEPSDLEFAWFTARAPLALAEASKHPLRAFRDYPMKTPRFEYEENATEGATR
jgi:hypothetical protein